MRGQQWTDQHAADRVGGRPVGGIPARQPALPHHQEPRCEIAAEASNDFNPDKFDFEMAVADEYVREGDGLTDRPVVPLSRVYRAGECADRPGADIVEAKIDIAAKIACSVKGS